MPRKRKRHQNTEEESESEMESVPDVEEESVAESEEEEGDEEAAPENLELPQKAATGSEEYTRKYSTIKPYNGAKGRGRPRKGEVKIVKKCPARLSHFRARGGK